MKFENFIKKISAVDVDESLSDISIRDFFIYSACKSKTNLLCQRAKQLQALNKAVN